MLTDNRADYRTQDWFLIACEGDLVLKLAQDLMIGEDERGQTVLSPAREDALLRITSEHGCLTLQALAMDWTFSEEGGLSLQHLTFVEGLTLKLLFPSSSLILTPDFQAGAGARIDREIRLMPTETPTLTLTRVDEPVTLIEPALLPAPEAANSEHLDLQDLMIEEAAEQARAADSLRGWDHQIPDETAETPPPARISAPAADSQTVSASVELATPAVQTPAPAEQPAAATAVFEEIAAPTTVPKPVRKSHRLLAGLIAASALITPMYLFFVDGDELGVDFPLTNYQPLEAADSSAGTVERAPRTEPATLTAAPAAADPGTTVPMEAESVLPVQAPAPGVPEQQSPVAAAHQQLLIDSLLAEAKAYYDAGYIVTPIEANAVNHLTQVLNMDPANEDGLRLMYMSAMTLIEQAEAAHAAGDNYLARNLVEDVLGFHPEFDDARALLDSWARDPEG